MAAEVWAEWLVRGVGLYLGIGLPFGIAFVLRGLDRVDPAARGSSRGFRWILLPGAVALWPLLARRWLAGTGSPPVESNAHRRAAGPAGPP